jgi:hypothetical protein
MSRYLRAIGASVEIVGQPLDLLVGHRGVNIIVEVKQPPGPRGGTSKHGQKLNEKQAAFRDTWRGAPPLTVTLADCVAQVEAEADRRSR